MLKIFSLEPRSRSLNHTSTFSQSPSPPSHPPPRKSTGLLDGLLEACLRKASNLKLLNLAVLNIEIDIFYEQKEDNHLYKAI